MAVETAADFAAALTDLRVRAGMSVRDVSRVSGIPPATLGGYFSGRHLPPVTQPRVLARMLQALGVEACEVEHWRDELVRVRRTPGPRPRRATPYRGLESFRADDAEWYFGRDELAGDVRSRIEKLLEGDEPRFVTVVGASGSGKSSLLRAGVVPRVEGVGAVVCVPGADPVAALALAERALEEGLAERPAVLVVDQFEEVFHDRVDDAARSGFLERLAELASPDRHPACVVVAALRADFYGHAVAEPALFPLLDRQQVLVGPMSQDELRQAIVEPALRAGRPLELPLVELLLRDLAPRARAAQDVGVLPLLSHALLATWNQARGDQLTVADYLATGGIAGAVQQTAEEVYADLETPARRTARRLFSQLVSLDDDGVATRRRTDHADLVDDDNVAGVVETFVARRILSATEHTVEISHEVLLEAWPRLRRWLEQDQDSLRLRRRIALSAADWDAHGREPEALMRGGLLTVARGLAERAAESVPLAALERGYLDASIDHDDRRSAAERTRQARLRRLFVVVAVLAVVACLLSAYLIRAIGEARDQRNAADTARREALSRQVAIQSSQLATTDPALAAQLALSAYRIHPTVEARSALLEVTGRAQATRLTGPEGPMRAVGSPDGRTLAVVSVDGKVRFWDRPSDGEAPTLVATVPAGTGGNLFAAAYSPDGRTFAAGGVDGGLTVFDVSDPRRPRAWPTQPTGPASAVQFLAFSPDGSVLAAAASDPALFRWSLADRTPRMLPTTSGFGVSVGGVTISPDGRRYATASSDAKVRIWRQGAAARPLRLESEFAVGGEANYQFAVAFSPDGRRLAAAGKDKRVRVWDVSGPDPSLVTDRLRGFGSWVNGVVWSHDGTRLAAAASGGVLQVWSTDDWTVVDSMSAGANLTSVDFLAGDRQLAVGGIDGTTRLHRVVGPRVSGLGDNVWGIGYTSEGDRLYAGVGSQAPAVHAFDGGESLVLARVGKPLTGPAAAGALDGTVAVSPDGRLLAAGTANGALVVWRRADGDAWRRVGTLPAATQLIENVVFSADGRVLASSADDGSVDLYDTGGSGLPRQIADLDAQGLALGLAVNADASLVAVGTADNRIRVWHRVGTAYEQLDPLEGFENYVYALAFSPDGSVLAGGSTDKTVRRWAVRGTELTPLGEPLRGPRDTVFSLAFDGDRLAGASSDGSLWIWQLDGADAEHWARLRGSGPGLFQVALHPRRPEVTAAGGEGNLWSWSLDVDRAAEQVCAVSGTEISREEWEIHVPGAAYAPPCRS